jgi:8-oxo-dGTP pyrophosphatase MutT (NUDIX family)
VVVTGQALPEVAHRRTVRAVIVDRDDRVLLFHTHDPAYPVLGTWWELPGGGIEPDETYLQAIVREVAEETGIAVTAGQVGAPTWRRRSTFRYRGQRRLYHEVVVPIRLDDSAPAVVGDGRVDFENEDYFDYRCMPTVAVAASVDRFYPGQLQQLLERFLAGEQIDEPFEVWS